MGYIGLPTAAVLASRKVKVVGLDVNQHVVETINCGEVHILEPELDALVRTVVQTGYLRATMKAEKADVFIVAVPTPLKEHNEPNISYIESAVKAILPVIEKSNIVIFESTSPVGTTEKMVGLMQEMRPDLNFPVFGADAKNIDISVAYCPERVLPGHILRELVKNDRIIGGVTAKCAKRIQEVYKIFVKADCFITDCKTAELSKLVENAFRDVNIAFANELSLICDKLQINVWDLINLANRHPRVNILQPGPGVGGHCIAVDPWFIVASEPDKTKLIHAARMINDGKPLFVLEKINKAVRLIGKEKSELSIACLGLAFKADVDDLRESPALAIAQQVGKMGFGNLVLVEPYIEEFPEGFYIQTTEMLDLELALFKVDLVVLLVDHKPFKELDQRMLSGKEVIDTRGIWRSI